MDEINKLMNSLKRKLYKKLFTIKKHFKLNKEIESSMTNMIEIVLMCSR